jgi:hypothetical protein
MIGNTHVPCLPMQARGSEQSLQPMSGKVHHDVLPDPIFDISKTHDAIMKGQIEVTENQ